MICVSIGRGRHRHMIAEHKHLAEQGTELVELRLDYINGDPNLRRLLADKPTPVVITCRRRQDGGKWSKDENARQLLLRQAVAEGVDYVDLEEDLAGSIPRFGQTKRIVSYHNFRKTPEDLPEIHARLAAMDADIVKIATMANHTHDCFRLLDLIRNSETPTIAFAMGDIGTPSRVLAARYGAPFTYASFSSERALAPGQLSIQQMKDVYQYERITSETSIYGVIADPIGHSLSPHIHNACFRQLDIDAVYLPFRVPREDLAQFVDDAQSLGVKGLSVTIPHKENIAQFLTKVERAVKGINAANTVVFRDEGVHGYNTDYKAAIDSLELGLDGLGNEPSPLANRRVFLLGAGGVARAIAFGLSKTGSRLVIASRTKERACDLADDFGGECVDWDARHNVKFDVLVNCTPIGMHPNVDEAPFEKHYLKPSHLVFDTVYNPETTLLVKRARERNCRVVTGVEMFVRQAALQFKLFTGQNAPVETIRETLKREVGPVKY